MTIRFCDETGFGFGWIVDEPYARCSQALADDDGRVWIVDPVAWEPALERARSLGDLVAVVQLLDRHNRDCAEVAARLGVPHLRLPEELPPFEVVRVVDVPRWRERALWWSERSVLVVAEAVGTNAVFRARGERLAVHPLLRLTPPRRLARFESEHVLVGHGEGVHDGAAEALREAIRTSRRRIPRWLASRVLL